MTQLYKISADKLVPIPEGQLSSEDMIEGWVARQPELLGRELLVIGRQVQTDFGGRIDLLGLDSGGNLVLIELKRNMTSREVIAQVLDYASWIATLKTPQIHDIAKSYLGLSLETAFRSRFDIGLPDTLNSNHTMLIVASALDASSQRIVRYLAEIHDLAINTAFFTVFSDGADVRVTTDWLMNQEEVVERSEARTRAPWSGLWYVNVGEGEHRAWEDMRRYGFIAAGGGRNWSGPLMRLQREDRIVAYQKKAGYVGYGKVTKTAVMAREFETDHGPLLDQPLVQPGLARDRDDPEHAEYVVGVDWTEQVATADAKWSAGLFANQNVVCKLRDQKTLEFLKEQFGIVEV